MADDTEAGLPVRQLLKMVASGDLSPAEFKQLTKHVIGYDEEVPIDMTGDDTLAAETEASAQRMRAAPSPAAAAHTPTATEAGIGKDGKDDDEHTGRRRRRRRR